jgi:hypothetical protein
LGEHCWFSLEYQVGSVESVAIPVDAAGFWFIDFPQFWFAICGDDTYVCWFVNRFFYSILPSHQVILNAGDNSSLARFLGPSKSLDKKL